MIGNIKMKYLPTWIYISHPLAETKTDLCWLKVIVVHVCDKQIYGENIERPYLLNSINKFSNHWYIKYGYMYLFFQITQFRAVFISIDTVLTKNKANMYVEEKNGITLF